MATVLENRAYDFFEKHRGTKTVKTDGELIRKLGEEFGEFVEAVMNGDDSEAMLEASDIHLLLIDFAMKRQKSLAAYTDVKLTVLEHRWSDDKPSR